MELYLEIVDKQANNPYHKEEDILMNAARSCLLEFYMPEDMSFRVIQKLGVPLDGMARIHFVPIIKY